MTNFDPNSFLNQTISGGFSTRVKPVPPGEYPAIIKSLGAREVDSKMNPGQKQLVVDVTFALADPSVAEATGRPEPTTRLSLWIDRTAGGAIDRSEGKNIGLGRLLAAIGMNMGDAEFSFNDLIGKSVLVSVTNNPDKNDPETVYDNVSKVAAI